VIIVIHPPGTTMILGRGVGEGVIVGVGVSVGIGVSVEVAVGVGVSVSVGGTVGVAVGGWVFVGSGVLLAVGGNEVSVAGIVEAGALAVANAAGTRVSSDWALATAVEPQGTSVASSCTAMVDIVAATSSRVQPIWLSKPTRSKPTNITFPLILVAIPRL